MKTGLALTLNGVDVARMQETAAAVKASPAMGHFNFRIENEWIAGGENRSDVGSFTGCGQTFSHRKSFTLAADEPEILLGGDRGANPVEHLLHALASCVTTSMVYHAAARGIRIEAVESTLDGDLDLNGFLGLDPAVRNGYREIRMKLRIRAEVTDEQLRELGNLGPLFSPVYDSVSHGVPVSLSVERIG